MEVRNRFQGLDLIDRVPEKLWTEVRDIVRKTGIKNIPPKKKCKKAKWLSEYLPFPLSSVIRYIWSFIKKKTGNNKTNSTTDMDITKWSIPKSD